jgi:hypothetical protein
MTKLPDEFSSHPGDVMAYQCWKSARQNADFQNGRV